MGKKKLGWGGASVPSVPSPQSFSKSGGGNKGLDALMAAMIAVDRERALGPVKTEQDINKQKQMMPLELEQKKLAQQQSQQMLGAGVPTKAVGESVTTESPNARYFTAEAENQLTRIKQIKKVTKGLQDLAKTFPTDLPSAAYQSFGAKYMYGRGGTDQTRVYNQGTPAASAGVYRAVTGDNRLSDVDAAQRAKPLFWDTMEPAEVREGKFAFLNFMLDEAEKNVDPMQIGEPKDDSESQLRWDAFVQNSKQKFDNMMVDNPNLMPNTPSTQTNPVNQSRGIGSVPGLTPEDPVEAIKKRFKQRNP